jgi:hypothetical protein
MRSTLPRRQAPSLRRLQQQFLAVLPRIQRQAAFVFRRIRCAVQREEFLGETVALAWQWFVRLRRRGQDATRFVSALASLAARAVGCGRRLAGGERANDVLSPVAQRRHGFQVASLPVANRTSQSARYSAPHGQGWQDAFEERLHENAVTPVPDQVQFRLDWPRFFATLSPRDRRLATFLALGHSGQRAAGRFGLSPGRVTQLRQQWRRQWRAFVGDAEGAASPSPCLSTA